MSTQNFSHAPAHGEGRATNGHPKKPSAQHTYRMFRQQAVNFFENNAFVFDANAAMDAQTAAIFEAGMAAINNKAGVVHSTRMDELMCTYTLLRDMEAVMAILRQARGIEAGQ